MSEQRKLHQMKHIHLTQNAYVLANMKERKCISSSLLSFPTHWQVSSCGQFKRLAARGKGRSKLELKQLVQ